MKISLDRIKSRLDTAGEKISETEDIAVKLAKMKQRNTFGEKKINRALVAYETVSKSLAYL